LFEINKIFPSIKFQSYSSPCDVCFYAKKKRLQFPHSQHVSQSIYFYLGTLLMLHLC
jgi:hypothetical protein